MTDHKTDQRQPKDILDWLGLRHTPAFVRARWFGAGVTVVLTLLFVVALTAAVMVLVHTIGRVSSPDAEGPNLGAGALIAALLGAPFLIWATVIKQTTLNFQKEGHITDRISKAVEQLGAEKTVKTVKDGVSVEESKPNIEVRIGGLLGLERIAQDSTRYDNGRDHVRVMEILCAYVRENAPASGAKNFPLPDWESLPDDADEAARAKHIEWREVRFGNFMLRNGNATQWAKSLASPRADIAIALQIIGRRGPDQLLVEARWGHEDPDAKWVFDQKFDRLPDKPGAAALTKAELNTFMQKLLSWRKVIGTYQGYRPDLRNTNLQSADLSNATLSGAKLNSARMEGANLWRARLEGTNLWLARLEGAVLRQARMEGAILWQARIEGANLSDARMEGANLGRARMEGAHLWQTRIEGGHLGKTLMEGANLAHARMEGTDLGQARMEGVNLGEARMEGAFLEQARMEEANLWHAQLEGTNLKQSRLDRANLWQARIAGANFWRAQLKSADLDGWTIPRASLRSADLSDCNTLTQDSINTAWGDSSTILPSHVQRPDHWPDTTLENRFDPDPAYDAWLAAGAPPGTPRTTT